MKLKAVSLTCIALLGGFAFPARGQNPGTQYASLNSVGAGTRFLAVLEDALSTDNGKVGERFRARTIEPLPLSNGALIGPGLEIRGHVDKVQSAHRTGRAKMWLTFDEIKTQAGWVPVVADLADLPGVHSVQVDFNREGEIEARTSKREAQAEAAAAGAMAGAASGVAAHSERDAAMGAATGAAAGFMVASGLGQEFTLAKNTKLELILDRPMYPERF
jgi:hypothetical protein